MLRCSLLRFNWCLLLLLLLLLMVVVAGILYRLRMAAEHCTGLYCVIGFTLAARSGGSWIALPLTSEDAVPTVVESQRT